MAQRQLRFVFITLIAAATAACAASAAGTVPIPTPTAVRSASPPSGVSSAATLTLGDFGDADGPGISVSDAIAYVGGEPLLVNGILLRTADGTVWLCEVLQNSSPPQCSEPGLHVVHWPPEDQTFVNGDGLHVAGDVRWVDHVQLFGVVHR
jgi:hypothetical protein